MGGRVKTSSAAHDRNDQMLERIYLGRRFKNDTERLEKLFELYTKMTASAPAAKKAAKKTVSGIRSKAIPENGNFLE